MQTTAKTWIGPRLKPTLTATNGPGVVSVGGLKERGAAEPGFFCAKNWLRPNRRGL